MVPSKGMLVNSKSRCHEFGSWLVAHDVVSGKTVVTNEQPRPESRNQIKLPDVCNAFSVDFEDTFAMLHKLNVQYHFSPNL